MSLSIAAPPVPLRSLVRYLADENFNVHIVNGVLRRCPETDILRLQDIGLARADDPSVLAWAASERRILLTHAVNTVTVFAYERVIRGLLMPDVFEVPLKLPIGAAIDDIILCSKAEEGDGQTTTFHSYEVGMWEFHPLIQDGL